MHLGLSDFPGVHSVGVIFVFKETHWLSSIIKYTQSKCLPQVETLAFLAKCTWELYISTSHSKPRRIWSLRLLFLIQWCRGHGPVIILFHRDRWVAVVIEGLCVVWVWEDCWALSPEATWPFLKLYCLTLISIICTTSIVPSFYIIFSCSFFFFLLSLSEDVKIFPHGMTAIVSILQSSLEKKNIWN